MWPTTCMWCWDRDVFFFSGKTERWQKVLETSLLHRAWWLMSMKLIHLMKSQSYVFPFKCLKTNKQGWRWGKSAAFYMKLKRSNSVEWLKGEYIPEEVPPSKSTVQHCSQVLRLAEAPARGHKRQLAMTLNLPAAMLTITLGKLKRAVSAPLTGGQSRHWPCCNSSPGDSSLQPGLRKQLACIPHQVLFSTLQYTLSWASINKEHR